MTDGSLTKAALIEQVAHAADLTKKRAAIIVDTLFGSIAEALHHGEKVELRGFGSFRLRCRGPHRGRNPRTGDRVDVPLKRVAYFKPGKELRELIKEPGAAGPAGARVAGVEPLLRRATLAAGGGSMARGLLLSATARSRWSWAAGWPRIEMHRQG